jgi:hypothetical protein
MDPELIIETIRERRAGIDMIAMPWEARTFFAEPDSLREGVGETLAGGCQIPRIGGRTRGELDEDLR